MAACVCCELVTKIRDGRVPSYVPTPAQTSPRPSLAPCPSSVAGCLVVDGYSILCARWIDDGFGLFFPYRGGLDCYIGITVVGLDCYIGIFLPELLHRKKIEPLKIGGPVPVHSLHPTPPKHGSGGCGLLRRVFFTVGNRAVYRGYRCYRRGTVTVPSGSNRPKIQIWIWIQKMKKSIKFTKK
jgi:hypothetical protein